ncbi:FKBP-type peptidyl-prolyl cis-trans isomerase [Sphingomonas soli]|uniref:FKBP-type peptidyl-prolyl cis-trans isomerase n=1 Tax=Sphingomonas soli TaxID=266127 RepID=UPI000A07966B|nr:FKBP-type peptidyl-prolyl cis-trans isomerase [Sphingomonas soli]
MSSVTAVPLQPVKRSHKVWLWIGVIVAIALAAALAWSGTRAAVAAKGTDAQFLAWNKGQPGVKTTASGLEYQVLKEGEGNTASEGDYILVNYEGSFRNGKIFDKSDRPAPFPLQEGASIKGFYEGLKMVKAGGVYRFWIPAELAYGAQSPDPERIPANSMLIFKVTVDRIIPAAIVQQMMMQQQMQGGGPQGAPPQGGPEGAAPQGGPEGAAPKQ